jgi:transcription-repair coupling factor (superfamily II helicase)
MESNIVLKVGSCHTLSQLIMQLVDFGYEKGHDELINGRFNNIGGSLRIFPVGFSNPVLVDFFGNEIESIKSYEPKTSKTITSLNEVTIVKNNLILTDKSIARPGDYLVHEDHGIGLYDSRIIKSIAGENIEYVLIKYLNNDLLYVPIAQIDKLSSYVGLGRKKPKLNKLGGVGWKRSYKKTYENIIQMAKELLQVYATREVVKKLPRSINNDWNDQIVQTFGFADTVDQAEAINNAYNDMQQTRPMDRLVCGDVGFGKTEVAIRAAAQAVANGYQVAILVPTTVLAEQHFVTLSKRFANLPVRIERLSRFVDAVRQKLILDEIASQSVDIIIGTHKLLSDNIIFKNLGLLVIDEEQKFGPRSGFCQRTPLAGIQSPRVSDSRMVKRASRSLVAPPVTPRRSCQNSSSL